MFIRTMYVLQSLQSKVTHITACLYLRIRREPHILIGNDLWFSVGNNIYSRVSLFLQAPRPP